MGTLKSRLTLIHGRTGNTQENFGVKTKITIGSNRHYDEDYEGINIKSNLNEVGEELFYKEVESHEIIRVFNFPEPNNRTETTIGSQLQNNKYLKNKSLYAFNYPNLDMVHKNADLLGEYITGLKKHAKESDNKGYIYRTKTDWERGNAKFNLVVHSMGGLVSRYYIENGVGASNIKKLITIDTPHYGSGFATAANVLNRTSLFNPCDLDLMPNSPMYGGDHPIPNKLEKKDEKIKYAYLNRTEEKLSLNTRGVKYYFIAGYDEKAKGCPPHLSNRTFMFDVNIGASKFSNFDEFKTIIKNEFRTQYEGEKSYDLDIDMNSGDNVVNTQSQLGIKFSSSGKEIEEKVISKKSAITLDTIAGHWVNEHFHGETLFRRLTCYKVIEYLKE